MGRTSQSAGISASTSPAWTSTRSGDGLGGSWRTENSGTLGAVVTVGGDPVHAASDDTDTTMTEATSRQRMGSSPEV